MPFMSLLPLQYLWFRIIKMHLLLCGMETDSVAMSQGHLSIKVKAFQTDFYVHIGYYTVTRVYKSLS